MYRSYSFNNMPRPVEPAQEITKPAEIVKKPQRKEEQKLPLNLKSDDLILLLVIVMLIFNECDDKLLILALIYIFFSDYLNGRETAHPLK